MVTGNLNAECGMRNAESVLADPSSRRFSLFPKFRTPHSALRTQKGFSLLELMITMFIMIILLSIAVPTYEKSVRQARETVLKENLWQVRRAIDQFTADKGKLPSSVEDLVTDKYLREKPVDPITDKTEWQEIQGEDTNSPDSTQGLKDVKSMAEGSDSDGKAYSEY